MALTSPPLVADSFDAAMCKLFYQQVRQPKQLSLLRSELAHTTFFLNANTLIDVYLVDHEERLTEGERQLLYTRHSANTGIVT